MYCKFPVKLWPIYLCLFKNYTMKENHRKPNRCAALRFATLYKALSSITDSLSSSALVMGGAPRRSQRNRQKQSISIASASERRSRSEKKNRGGRRSSSMDPNIVRVQAPKAVVFDKPNMRARLPTGRCSSFSVTGKGPKNSQLIFEVKWFQRRMSCIITDQGLYRAHERSSVPWNNQSQLGWEWILQVLGQGRQFRGERLRQDWCRRWHFRNKLRRYANCLQKGKEFLEENGFAVWVTFTEEVKAEQEEKVAANFKLLGRSLDQMVDLYNELKEIIPSRE